MRDAAEETLEDKFAEQKRYLIEQRAKPKMLPYLKKKGLAWTDLDQVSPLDLVIGSTVEALLTLLLTRVAVLGENPKHAGARAGAAELLRGSAGRAHWARRSWLPQANQLSSAPPPFLFCVSATQLIFISSSASHLKNVMPSLIFPHCAPTTGFS